MPKAARKSAKSKKSAPYSAKKPSSPKDEMAPLFKSTPRAFRVGGDVRPKTDLRRFVRWPKYVRVQRQRKVLNIRLKVPPAINQFNNALDKNQATELFRLLDNYRPETKAAKKERIKALAEKMAAGGDAKQEKPGPVIKFGINHVTDLIEKKVAKLVVIATDVDPIELVLWMPALCRLQGIPYVIVKNKARVGALVHQKVATCVALTAVNREHEHTLQKIIDMANESHADVKARRKWGGGKMGLKTTRRLEKRAQEIAAAEAKKALAYA